MGLAMQVLAATALDLALGDPRWLPHPVRGIGWLAARLEAGARRTLGATRLAGLLTALAVYAAAGLAAWGAVRAAAQIAPLAADVAAVLVIYSTIAPRDLAKHSRIVWRDLASGDLAAARRSVANIVGRDVEGLDVAGVTRAAVESVAESTVDGVTAPLFYALVGGPVGALVYRAVNTLDSMFGHLDDRYRHFGWAAARIDDAANWLPARLTAPLLCLAALLLRQRPLAALRILVRDGRKHASPNAGLTEAAMAGALGVQLGGPVSYDGELVDKPGIGDDFTPLEPRHIRAANAMMFATTGLFLAVGLAVRYGIASVWCAGGRP
jgi:adenosylcobinamide-phosphate synthase